MTTKLSIRGLEMVYETEAGPLTVIDGIDMDVETNDFVSIVGTSGCGKSTLRWVGGGVRPPPAGGGGGGGWVGV
jgi:ABC-type nitrate/sulfonate/bicarbonate transport system ATPase subunit